MPPTPLSIPTRGPNPLDGDAQVWCFADGDMAPRACSEAQARLLASDGFRVAPLDLRVAQAAEMLLEARELLKRFAATTQPGDDLRADARDLGLRIGQAARPLITAAALPARGERR